MVQDITNYKLYLVVLLFWGSPAAAYAQTTISQGPEAPVEVDQRYSNMKVSVYSQDLREPGPDDWGVDLNIKVSASIYEYETFGEILDREIEHIQSIGIRPKLEFDFPLPVEHLSFVPDIELAWNHVFDGERDLISGSTAAALRYRRPMDGYEFLARTELRYGTRYLEDGLNLDDYLEFSLETHWGGIISVPIGARKLGVTPVLKYSEFIDDLEFIADGGRPFDIERKYEIGLEFNTAPRLRVGPVPLPRLRISYVFGHDFQGIQIRL